MLIAMPSTPVAREIEWEIEQPSQANRSEFTGKRRVVLLPQAPRWGAKVTLPPIIGEAAVLAWRAFVVDCDGSANWFRLIAVEGRQMPGNPDVRVAGAGQGGNQLATKGWGTAGLKLRRGQMITLADQLLMLNADVVAAADGTALLTVKPYLRTLSVDNAPIEVIRPYAVVSLADSKAGWKVGIGQQYEITFEVEEAF